MNAIDSNAVPSSGQVADLPFQNENGSKKKLLILAGVLCGVLLTIVVAVAYFSNQKQTQMSN